MHRDPRVDLGLYRNDRPDDVVKEMDAACAMFARLWEAIDPEALSRTVRYGYPSPTVRSLLWMGQQAVHETEHHLGDIVENGRLLA